MTDTSCCRPWLGQLSMEQDLLLCCPVRRVCWLITTFLSREAELLALCSLLQRWVSLASTAASLLFFLTASARCTYSNAVRWIACREECPYGQNVFGIQARDKDVPACRKHGRRFLCHQHQWQDARRHRGKPQCIHAMNNVLVVYDSH